MNEIERLESRLRELTMRKDRLNADINDATVAWWEAHNEWGRVKDELGRLKKGVACDRKGGELTLRAHGEAGSRAGCRS